MLVLLLINVTILEHPSLPLTLRNTKFWKGNRYFPRFNRLNHQVSLVIMALLSFYRQYATDNKHFLVVTEEQSILLQVALNETSVEDEKISLVGEDTSVQQEPNISMGYVQKDQKS